MMSQINELVKLEKKKLIKELINNLRSLQMINRNESCLFADYYYKVNDIQELIKKLEEKLK